MGDKSFKPTMNQAAFATFAGVSKKTVTIWKTKGFLVMTGNGLVDVEPSVTLLKDRGYGNFEDESSGVTQEAEVTPDVTRFQTVTRELTTDEIAERLIQSGAFELLSHAEAERLKENFLALSQRLKFEKDAGSLVDRAQVEQHFATRWAEERNAWETWPSGVAADLATQLGVDQIKMRVALEEAVREHLLSRVRQADNAVH